MNYVIKEKLFKDFLSEWGSQFDKIPFILNYINSYPKVASKFDDLNFIRKEILSESQLEWVSLIAQFDNPIEKDFFKNYWIPIQSDSYDYFIDLSSEKLSMIEVNYFFFEPYRWYKTSIIEDITKLLISIDNPLYNLKDHLKMKDYERWSEVINLFKERDELGFAGKIFLNPIIKENLFDRSKESSCRLRDDMLIINGINSVIIGLLPFDFGISLIQFNALYNKHENVKGKIKNIKAFLYLLQSVGYLSVKSYYLTFTDENGCYAEFQDNIIRIKHANNNLLKEISAKYIYHKNS